ncbi:MAG: protein kinase, partial [Verrucomicrobiae bacterium]|nr:protein kinase [Verrucomicrobiae bacterium]
MARERTSYNTAKLNTAQLARQRAQSKSRAKKPRSRPKTTFPTGETTLRSAFRYKVIRQLGDGGVGRAFLAHEYDSIDTFRPVALKMLHTPEDEALMETFILEAKLMRLMTHPNILEVYAFEKGTSAF